MVWYSAVQCNMSNRVALVWTLLQKNRSSSIIYASLSLGEKDEGEEEEAEAEAEAEAEEEGA